MILVKLSRKMLSLSKLSKNLVGTCIEIFICWRLVTSYVDLTDYLDHLKSKFEKETFCSNSVWSKFGVLCPIYSPVYSVNKFVSLLREYSLIIIMWKVDFLKWAIFGLAK